MSTHKRSLELILYGRAGCCLCDRLEALIEPHLHALRPHTMIHFIKRDLTNDPHWHQRYQSRIPVLTCGPRVILEGRPDSDQIARAFAELTLSNDHL